MSDEILINIGKTMLNLTFGFSSVVLSFVFTCLLFIFIIKKTHLRFIFKDIINKIKGLLKK